MWGEEKAGLGMGEGGRVTADERVGEVEDAGQPCLYGGAGDTSEWTDLVFDHVPVNCWLTYTPMPNASPGSGKFLSYGCHQCSSCFLWLANWPGAGQSFLQSPQPS